MLLYKLVRCKLYKLILKKDIQIPEVTDVEMAIV